jgi:hypothetical protein
MHCRPAEASVWFPEMHIFGQDADTGNHALREDNTIDDLPELTN